MTAIPADELRDASVSGALADIVTNHLILAEYMHRWANDLNKYRGAREAPKDEIDFMLGYQRALRDLAGHLRAGDGLPGGPVHQGFGAA